MKKLFAFLISGCWHQWETKHVAVLKYDTGDIGSRYVLRCTKCGDVVKRDLI